LRQDNGYAAWILRLECPKNADKAVINLFRAQTEVLRKVIEMDDVLIVCFRISRSLFLCSSIPPQPGPVDRTFGNDAIEVGQQAHCSVA
jgi:hypothetical protein